MVARNPWYLGRVKLISEGIVCSNAKTFQGNLLSVFQSLRSILQSLPISALSESWISFISTDRGYDLASGQWPRVTRVPLIMFSWLHLMILLYPKIKVTVFLLYKKIQTNDPKEWPFHSPLRVHSWLEFILS